MNANTVDRLYNLLPELYRWRDESHDRTLQAFLSVIQEELGTLEADIEAMYDNWFIQTCDDWAVPYIADLLGVRNTAHGEHMPFTQRRRVANTLAYRRRKGTIAVLEQIAWDVTNWHVSAREGYQLVAATRHLHHPSAPGTGMIDLRRDVVVAGAGDPLSSVLHTVDVRTPAARSDERRAGAPDDLQETDRSLPALYGMENVGLHFWRLRTYVMVRSPACRIEQNGAPAAVRVYSFSADGRDLPLFNRPQPFRTISQRAERINLPTPLTRLALDADLRAYRAEHLSGDAPSGSPASLLPQTSDYYGSGRALNIIVKDSEGKELNLAPWQITSGDLSRPPAASTGAGDNGLMAVVDPELGRLALYGGDPARSDGSIRVLVDFTYAFSGDIGGGPYARRYNPDRAQGPICEINVVAGCANSPTTGDLVDRVLAANSLGYALGLWTTYCERVAGNAGIKPRGLIRILDNGNYPLTDDAAQTDGDAVGAIWLPTGGELAIIADNGVQPTIGAGAPVTIVFENPRRRLFPPIAAAVAFIAAEPAPPRVVDRALVLGGLRLMGVLTFDEGDVLVNTLDVTIEDCRLLGGIQAMSMTNARAAQVSVARSICGPLRLSGEIAGLSVSDSIIDANLERGSDPGRLAIDCSHRTTSTLAKPAIVIERSTVLGAVRLVALARAEAVLFAAKVEVQELQHGRMRFCYLPSGSKTPPCQNCLHEDAGADACEHCKTYVGRPVFTSRRYGQPGYAQLAGQTPALFHTITGDGGEIGVFHNLYQMQREANLRDVLERYLPLGFRAGIFFVT